MEAAQQRGVWSRARIWHVGGSRFVMMGLGPVYSKHVPVCRECFLCVVPGAGSSASSRAAGGAEENLPGTHLAASSALFSLPGFILNVLSVLSLSSNCLCCPFSPHFAFEMREASDGFQTRSICLYLNQFIRLIHCTTVCSNVTG